MPLTRSTIARRACRLVATAFVPVVLGAACGGGGGSGDTGTAVGSGDATATTAAASGDATATTAAASSGQPAASGADDWCQVIGLMNDKIANTGAGAALTYPQLVEKMQSVQTPADVVDAWSALEAVLAKPGFDPHGPDSSALVDATFNLAMAGFTYCPSP